MSDSQKGRYPRKISVHDPNDANTSRPQSAASAPMSEKTVKAPQPPPLLNEDATLQVSVRVPLSEKTILADNAATTIMNRQELLDEATRLDRAAHHIRNVKQQQMLERTRENPKITDYLPADIRPTIATPAIGVKTTPAQQTVPAGSWREFIVEVDDQMCLVVPVEIARSGLLKPGRRLVARIRSFEE